MTCFFESGSKESGNGYSVLAGLAEFKKYLMQTNSYKQKVTQNLEKALFYGFLEVRKRVRIFL